MNRLEESNLAVIRVKVFGLSYFDVYQQLKLSRMNEAREMDAISPLIDSSYTVMSHHGNEL